MMMMVMMILTDGWTLQINALLARFDRNSDGQLDYNEFLMFYPEAKAAYVF